MFKYSVTIEMNGHPLDCGIIEPVASERLTEAVANLTHEVRDAMFKSGEPGQVVVGKLWINGKQVMKLEFDADELWRMNSSKDQTEANF